MKTFKEFINEAYGDKRDHKKIDIFVNGVYHGSTTWAKTHKEAKEKFLEKNPQHKDKKIQTQFSEEIENVSEAPTYQVTAHTEDGTKLVDKKVTIKGTTNKAVKSFMSKTHNNLLKKYHSHEPGKGVKMTGVKKVDEDVLDEGKIEPSRAFQFLNQFDMHNKDFHTLGSEHVDNLLDYAKEVGYRKSKNAPGSTARMFHGHLQRLANKYLEGREKKGIN